MLARNYFCNLLLLMEQMEHRFSLLEMDCLRILLANLSHEDTMGKSPLGQISRDFKEEYFRILKRLLYH